MRPAISVGECLGREDGESGIVAESGDVTTWIRREGNHTGLSD
jgi:hypothetical protein